MRRHISHSVSWSPMPYKRPTISRGFCSQTSQGKRVTFVPDTCRIYARTLWVMSGFGSCGPSPGCGRLMCASCSSGRHFAYSFLQTPPRGDSLAVRLAGPIPKAPRRVSPPRHRPDTVPAKRCSRTTRHVWRTTGNPDSCQGFVPLLPLYQSPYPALSPLSPAAFRSAISIGPSENSPRAAFRVRSRRYPPGELICPVRSRMQAIAAAAFSGPITSQAS